MLVINDARCTRETQPRTATAEVAHKRILVTSKFGLKCKEETSKLLHLELKLGHFGR
jgi:hypothetical protein